MNIPVNIFIDILYRMKLIRAVEETIAKKYPEQKMRCPTHLCTGQECVAAVAGTLLRSDDFAVSTHRAHGHYLGKGGDLKAMLAEIYGKVTGCAKGKGGSMHLIDEKVGFKGSTAIVGGTIPIGVGLGLSIKFKKKDQISCVFLGDGATEEGVFYESVNFAVLRKLPVLFLCENNLYSVYSPLKVRQPHGRAIASVVNSLGCMAESGDGNDVEDVFAKIHLAIERIREGQGPYFIEFATYRWREHCGPNFDNDIGYRSEVEFEEWKKRDPIPNFEKKCLTAFSDIDIPKMERYIMKQVNEAFEFAENSVFPEPDALFEGLYKENL